MHIAFVYTSLFESQARIDVIKGKITFQQHLMEEASFPEPQISLSPKDYPATNPSISIKDLQAAV